MGCCAASGYDDGASLLEACGPAAKRYFKLTGLPVSVSAKAHGRHLDLAVVGLDCREELLQLEVALQQRGFQVLLASLVWQGDLIDQRFSLEYMGKNAFKQAESSCVEVDKEIKLDIVPIAVSDLVAAFPESKIAVSGKENLLKLTATGKYSFCMRAVIVNALSCRNIKVVAASLSTSGSASAQVVNDSFWLLETAGWKIEELYLAVRIALVETVSVPRFSGDATPEKVYAAQNPQQLLTAINQVDCKNLLVHVKGLPRALRGALRGVRYPVRGPTSSGVQVEGFVKYIGAGLAKCSVRLGLPREDDDSPILEMRTCFIRENASKQAESDKVQWLKQVMQVEKEYAEFVTFLDVQSKTFVIFKAFLNGLLSTGNGYGASAIAEHLLHPPDTFCSALGGGESDEIGEWPSWLPSLINSIPDLEVIHICDVVNWNTYVLMDLAIKNCKRIEFSTFGEQFSWAIRAEIERSGFTETSFADSSQLEIFKRTNLGKMITAVLHQLNNQLGIRLQTTGIEVKLGKRMEYIMGQPSRQMDIRVFISSGASGEVGQGSALGLLKSSPMKKVASGNSISGMVPADHLRCWLPEDHNPGSGSALTDCIKESLSPAKIYAQNPVEHSRTDTFKKSISPGIDQAMDYHLGAVHFDDISFDMISSRTDASSNVSSLSSTLCLLGLATSILGLIHELQNERARSCLAVAAASMTADASQDRASDFAILETQRETTNKHMGQALCVLEKLWAPNAGTSLQAAFDEGITSFQNVSVKVLVQRQIVSNSCKTAASEWQHRYLVCCGGATGYNSLIAVLSRWLATALQALPLADPEVVQLRRDFVLLAMFKEQLGRERAYLACKAKARWNGLEEDEAILSGIISSRQQLHQRLGLNYTDKSDELDAISPILAQVTAMESSCRKEAFDPNFSVGTEDISNWFTVITGCINNIESKLREALQIFSGSCSQNSSSCLPTSLSYTSEEINQQLSTQVSEIIDISDMAFAVDLVQKLRDRHFTKIVALVGAGISVSADIPDFRSPGGLYDQMRQQGFTCPELVFTRDFVAEHPDKFFSFMGQLKIEGVEPTPTHHFLRLLHEKAMLLRCHTQNIDGLERKVGIPAERLIEAHGTMMASKCLECQLVHPIEDLWSANPADKIYPKCNSCGAFLRPDIVFFGEDLPRRFREFAIADVKNADLILVMGTSLSVQPFASLLREVKPGCPRLVLNRTVPAALKSSPWKKLSSKLSSATSSDLFLLGECDEGVSWIAKQLDWETELHPKRRCTTWRI